MDISGLPNLRRNCHTPFHHLLHWNYEKLHSMTTTMLPKVLFTLHLCFLEQMKRGSGHNKHSCRHNQLLLTIPLPPQQWASFLGIFLLPEMFQIVFWSSSVQEQPSPSLLFEKTSFQHQPQQNDSFARNCKRIDDQRFRNGQVDNAITKWPSNFLLNSSILCSQSQSTASQPTTFSPTSNKQKQGMICYSSQQNRVPL